MTSLITLAASGSYEYSESSPEVLTAEATTAKRDLAVIHSYFIDRIGELEADCERTTPWLFINAAVLIEYLTNLVVDPEKLNPKDSSKKVSKPDYERYIEFINAEWLPEAYKTFEYKSEHESVNGKTKCDLPLQMYCVLRSAMVHSFSMIPESHFWSEKKREESTSPTKYARKGSIVICHANSGNSHLSSYEKQDAACFVAEDFVKDIRSAIEEIFAKADKDEGLKERIEQVVNARPPLGIVEK